MAKGRNTWWIKLDYDWMRDEKVIELKARYGRAALVDAVNAFVVMAKCGGICDMARPAHAEWARLYMDKQGKALSAAFDRLAEVGIIDAGLWEGLGHVTSNRALADARAAADEDSANRARTRKATEAAAEKRRRQREAEGG